MGYLTRSNFVLEVESLILSLYGDTVHLSIVCQINKDVLSALFINWYAIFLCNRVPLHFQ